MKVIDFIGTSQRWQGTGQSRDFCPGSACPARPADFCPGPGPTGDKKCRDIPASPDVY